MLIEFIKEMYGNHDVFFYNIKNVISSLYKIL